MDNFNYQAYIKSGKIHGKTELLTESNNSVSEYVGDKAGEDNLLKDAAKELLKKAKNAGKSVKDYLKDIELGNMSKAMTSEDARTDAEQEGYKDGFEDAKDDIEAELKKMKVSELKAKIKEDILSQLAEAEEDVDVDVEDEVEADVDVDVEDDVNVDAEGDEVNITKKSVKADIEVGLSPEEELVQDSLEAAMKASQELGNQTLTDQIGNTITYFTRQFVVGGNTD